MATYSKRGYKAPKEKEVKDGVEPAIIDEKDSTTAEVFSKLDQTATITEDWVAKNQKVIALPLSSALIFCFNSIATCSPSA